MAEITNTDGTATIIHWAGPGYYAAEPNGADKGAYHLWFVGEDRSEAERDARQAGFAPPQWWETETGNV